MNVTRKAIIDDMLERIQHRRGLLLAKCVEGLTQETDVSAEIATQLTEAWLNLLDALYQATDDGWQKEAINYGQQCAQQTIPFETMVLQMYYYKRAVMPVLVREYPSLEGYLEAHLALDEAIALLMGKVPLGYFHAV